MLNYIFMVNLTMIIKNLYLLLLYNSTYKFKIYLLTLCIRQFINWTLLFSIRFIKMCVKLQEITQRPSEFLTKYNRTFFELKTVSSKPPSGTTRAILRYSHATDLNCVSHIEINRWNLNIYRLRSHRVSPYPLHLHKTINSVLMFVILE